MANPTPIYMTWSKNKLTRFKNDYNSGMTLEQLGVKHKISKGTASVIVNKLGLTGTRERKFHKTIKKDMAEVIIEMYPNHNWREIAAALKDKFGVEVTESNIKGYANRNGATKSEEYTVKLNATKTAAALQYLKENKEEVSAKKRATITQTIKSERRRALLDIPQRTKLHIQIAPNARKRTMIKSVMVRTNNYFSERGSRELYYDEQTKRSAYMERKYAKMFDFVAAEGFDEADSQWTKEYRKEA